MGALRLGCTSRRKRVRLNRAPNPESVMGIVSRDLSIEADTSWLYGFAQMQDPVCSDVLTPDRASA